MQNDTMMRLLQRAPHFVLIICTPDAIIKNYTFIIFLRSKKYIKTVFVLVFIFFVFILIFCFVPNLGDFFKMGGCKVFITHNCLTEYRPQTVVLPRTTRFGVREPLTIKYIDHSL